MRRSAIAPLLVAALLVLGGCSDGDDAVTTTIAGEVHEAGDDRLVGVDPPEDCHPMQGGWLMCGSTQDHGDDQTRGGLCTDGRLDDQLRIVPEVVFSESGACPTYLEVPPGTSIVFTNGGEEAYGIVIDGVGESSGPIEPDGDWPVIIDEVGQYTWSSDANEAITGLLEVKPLGEAPPVSTIVPAGEAAAAAAGS